MQVKTISGSGVDTYESASAPSAGSPVTAFGTDLVDAFVTPGSRQVRVSFPVSLAMLEAACKTDWAYGLESVESARQMSDAQFREWALGRLIAVGAESALRAPSSDGSGGSAERGLEEAEFESVVRSRLDSAFAAGQGAGDAADRVEVASVADAVAELAAAVDAGAADDDAAADDVADDAGGYGPFVGADEHVVDDAAGW